MIKLPRIDMGRVHEATFEEALSQSWARRPEPLARREGFVELCAALGLVAASVAILVGFETDVPFRPALALVLVVAYALAARVRFEVGAGFTSPVQLVFVPMLFTLPPGVVPLAAAAGFVLAKIPEARAGRIHPDRLVVAVGDAWFAVGPALCFAIAHESTPGWDDGALLVVATATQFIGDAVMAMLRVWAGIGLSPRLQLGALARVYVVDLLLTPIGFVSVIAAGDHPYRVLLVLPLLGLLAIFAQEREAHIESAVQLSTAYRGTALLLGDVLEDKDAYTASHSHGVVSLSLAVADKMRLDPSARRRVEFGALLHDIGKIAVPAEVINKPGPLDADEWAVMKLHTVEGQQMLDRVGGVLGEVGRVVRSSHEHFDGNGYPDGLTGEAIPIEARIVCACDAFSAMTTTRSYREAMSLDAAREELVRNAGTQFDPAVVGALLAVIRNDEVVVMPAAPDPVTPT